MKQLRYGDTVSDQLPGFRISSARRRTKRLSLVAASIAVVAAIFVVLAVRHNLRTRPQPAPRPAPRQRSTPIPTVVPPGTPAPTPTTLAERSSGWVEITAPTATSTPWPTLPPPPAETARPAPSPTPAPSQCVSFRWSAGQVFSPSAQVMIEIDVRNGCRRDFGALELWFEIVGWRRGDRVQSVRGHPFERIRAGRSGTVTIGLPGSIDWYDEITVTIVD